MTGEEYQKIFHEIKNNIAFINSSLQLIENQHPEIKSFSYWNDTVQEVGSLKDMLIDLSSARLSDTPDLKKVPSKAFLSELFNSCMTLFRSGNFDCETTFAAFLPDIYVDPNRIKRAFYNLIKNSYEAMNGSGRIRIAVSAKDAFVCIKLTDCGGGIALDYLPKLFTPFETTKSNGTGLGLLITRQIIEAHGGHLTVDSNPPTGCSFSVYLPVTE